MTVNNISTLLRDLFKVIQGQCHIGEFYAKIFPEFNLWPAITGSNIYLGANFWCSVARSRGDQSAVFSAKFYDASSGNAKGKRGRINPLTVRVIKNALSVRRLILASSGPDIPIASSGGGWKDPPRRSAPGWARASRKKRVCSATRDITAGTRK